MTLPIHKTEIHGHTTLAMAFSLIMGERCRQVEKGYDSKHDKEHEDESLVLASIAMLERSFAASIHDRAPINNAEYIWPWDGEMPERISQMRDLIIAAAMITAEIERRLDIE